MSTADIQAREIAVKFARDSISLIERGKASDVCARKLVAAAAVMHSNLGGTAFIEELLRDEVTNLQIKNTQLEAQVAELQERLNVYTQSEGVTLKP